jgi:DNA repair protein RadC
MHGLCNCLGIQGRSDRPFIISPRYILKGDTMNFWQVADASPEHWPRQRCLTEPSSAAIAELIQEITGVSQTKAQQVVEQICHQTSLLQADTDVTRFREVTQAELKNAGLTIAQSIRLLAALELGKRAYTAKVTHGDMSSPEKAADALMYDLGFSPVEKAAVLVLDIKHALISKVVFAVGACNACIVDPRVVFTKVLQHQGSRFILAHCHPSGCLNPSPEDLKLTEDLVQASQLMNLPLLDHLILGEGKHNSLRICYPEFWAGCEF